MAIAFNIKHKSAMYKLHNMLEQAKIHWGIGPEDAVNNLQQLI